MTDWPKLDPGSENLVLAGPLLARKLDAFSLGAAGLGGAPQIAVDGGIRFAFEPFLWAGDGDSGTPPKKIPALLKKSQDITDLRFCLDGIRGWRWRELHLFGFIGGRRDHELANFGEVYAELKQRRKFQRAVFYDADLLPHAVFYPAGASAFTHRGLFSVMTFENADVTISGACAFPADALALTALSGRGLSNEAKGQVHVSCPMPFAVFLPQEEPRKHG